MVQKPPGRVNGTPAFDYNTDLIFRIVHWLCVPEISAVFFEAGHFHWHYVGVDDTAIRIWVWQVERQFVGETVV